MAFSKQIDPAILAQLMMGQAPQGWGSTTNQYGWTGGDAGGASGPFVTHYYDGASDPNLYGVYDDQGNFLDQRTKEGPNAGLIKFLQGAAALYGAGSLINGGLLGLSSSAPGVSSSITGLTDTLGAITPANAQALQSALSPIATAGASAVPSSITGLTSLGALSAVSPQALSTALSPIATSAATSAIPGVVEALGGARTLAALGGALAGGMSSGDQQATQNQNSTQTSTTTKDPYGPAKAWIDANINQGQALQQQYKDNPFSDAQKTAYGNYAGLLNAVNSGATGLLGAANANASGANQFDRSNPRKALQGSSFNLNSFMPGLLSMFPGGGK